MINELTAWSPFWREWGWVLLHYVWQAAAISALHAAGVRLLAGPGRANARYGLGMVVLVALTVSPVVSWYALVPAVSLDASVLNANAAIASSGFESGFAGNVAANDGAEAVTPVETSVSAALLNPDQAMAWLGLAWLCGAAFLSLRLLTGWWSLRALRRGCEPIAGVWRGRAERLVRRLKFFRPPRIVVSPRVTQALATGIWRPCVILPAAWLTELPCDALEAVLLHELAHLWRWDAWVNVWQRLLETWFFFHPAVWWSSRQIRIDREQCCDELAIRLMRDPLGYAKTLETVARRVYGEPTWEFVSGIGGVQMLLLERVRNALGLAPRKAAGGFWPAVVLAAAVPCGLYLTGGTGNEARADDPDSPEFRAVEEERRGEREVDRARAEAQAQQTLAEQQRFRAVLAEQRAQLQSKAETMRAQMEKELAEAEKSGNAPRLEELRARMAEMRERIKAEMQKMEAVAQAQQAKMEAIRAWSERVQQRREDEARLGVRIAQQWREGLGREGDRPAGPPPPREEGERTRPERGPERADGGPRGDDELFRILRELRNEVQELRREVQELRGRGPMNPPRQPREGEAGPQPRRGDNRDADGGSYGFRFNESFRAEEGDRPGAPPPPREGEEGRKDPRPRSRDDLRSGAIEGEDLNPQPLPPRREGLRDPNSFRRDFREDDRPESTLAPPRPEFRDGERRGPLDLPPSRDDVRLPDKEGEKKLPKRLDSDLDPKEKPKSGKKEADEKGLKTDKQPPQKKDGEGDDEKVKAEANKTKQPKEKTVKEKEGDENKKAKGEAKQEADSDKKSAREKEVDDDDAKDKGVDKKKAQLDKKSAKDKDDKDDGDKNDSDDDDDKQEDKPEKP